MTTNSKEERLLECDYLVVGAGSSPLAFIDTLLTERPESKIILIDKKEAPGGHWVDAYGYVHLHQPSIVYGIASKQLEGNWLNTMLTKFTLPWNHRASKEEILNYYDNFVNEKVASQQVEYYPNSVFNFEEEEKDLYPSIADKPQIHRFSSVDGSVSYKVKVNVKLIDGTHGTNIIPHDSPFQFPVDEEVRVMTPNQIFDAFQEGSDKRNSMLENKYVVIGAGKTGMDAIVYLQRVMKVDPIDIAWVISNDVWMFNAAYDSSPSDFVSTLIKFNMDLEKTAFALEQKGALLRLDKNFNPTVFRLPSILPADFKLLRNIKTVIRRGRATAIRHKYNSNVVVEFGSDHPPWEAFAPNEKCVFVHASSPGPSNGAADTCSIFDSSKKMTLKLLYVPPITLSMSVLAKIEATRRKGTLDLPFMRRLALALGEEKLKVNKLTENDLLKMLLHSLDLDMSNIFRHQMSGAIIFAILDRDPMVALNWMKGNRLSFMSIPGMKSRVSDNVRTLCSKGNALGLSENDVRMLELVGEKLKPLEGK